ncbi:MAG: response regulator [Spartobacteria bacterium]|nr:response regulator [Spartobacteria bacterium]
MKNVATILIVDDEQKNIQMLYTMLEEEGYRVLIARNGQAAIESCEMAAPDCILLDVMMPGLDGFETCARFKTIKNASSIPVIFMTALADEESKRKAFQIGGVDYVTKPFLRSELLARIKTHLELYRTQQDLLRSNAEKDRILSVVAHDMGHPFSCLYFKTVQLSAECATLGRKEIMECSNAISQQAHRCYEMADNLLHWARTQGDKVTAECSSFNVSVLLDDVMALFRPLAEEKNIHIQLCSDHTVHAFADPKLIGIVLRNILSNAVKFTPENGMVSMAAKCIPHDKIQISVTDTGVGMSEERIAEILCRGAANSQAGTNGEPGCGMGLQISRDMLALMQGEMKISSSDKGTTIIVVLPIGDTSYIIEDSVRIPAQYTLQGIVGLYESCAANGRKVLIVDDDAATRKTIVSILSPYFSCDEASTGKEAVARVEKALNASEYYDLICMDVEMPGISGIETIEQIRFKEAGHGRQWWQTGADIIMISGHKETDVIVSCYDYSCRTYLFKPFDPQELLDKLVLLNFVRLR